MALSGGLKRWLVASALVSGLIVGIVTGLNPGSDDTLRTAWQMHTILVGASGAGQADGADGIARADFDGDGKLDAVTGHEQGLALTLSLSPGIIAGAVNSPWPATVKLPNGANMCSVEDAIPCDVDADGAIDIVAACETGPQRVEIMFSPSPPNTRTELTTAANWTRVTIDASANRRSMRAACVDLAGDGALELLIGEKDAGVASTLGYYSSATPRTGSSWTHTDIIPVGWVMDLEVLPNGNIFVSDKEGITAPSPDNSHRGLKLLINDGLDPPGFTETWISAVEGAWKWFDVVDWDGDADLDVVACRSEAPSLHEQTIWINGGGGSWSEIPIPIPASVGLCQETTAKDIDGDGDLDIGTSYSNATDLTSVGWMRRSGPALSPTFERGEISGKLSASSDVKMDNLEWWDIDEDGDLDAVVTEQHVATGTGPGLGVIWFANPKLPFVPGVAPPSVQCTVLTSGSQVAGTSAVTAAIAPGANRLIVAFVQTALTATAAPTTVSGAGLTFTQVATVPFSTSNARRITALRAMSASPGTGVVTIDMGGVNQTSFIWHIAECSGTAITGTNGGDAIVQSATQTATSATSITTTLAALEAATSVNLAASGVAIGGNQTPDADFVELAEQSVATGPGGIEVEWATNQAPVTPTFASANAGAIALELRIAP